MIVNRQLHRFRVNPLQHVRTIFIELLFFRRRAMIHCRWKRLLECVALSTKRNYRRKQYIHGRQATRTIDIVCRPENDCHGSMRTKVSVDKSIHRHRTIDVRFLTLVDRINTSATLEEQTEADLWSDIEPNSSDPIHENDLTSDDDDDSDDGTAVSLDNVTNSGSNSSSLFWQYNVQSKGPKTKRSLYLKERDPHIYREFSDPVYQIKVNQTKGNHFNKLRKGDGNDVTPNPMKLYELGKQIRDLSNNSASVYHGIYHVDTHTTSNETLEVRKQKNKIASR
jgi:hypothetical protein